MPRARSRNASPLIHSPLPAPHHSHLFVLQICGYGCQDHFLEEDTFFHSWQSLRALLQSDATMDILCDVGMPVIHRNTRYNCRVFCLNKKIVLIRPKLFLANDGNYREQRFFTSWTAAEDGKLSTFQLPRLVREFAEDGSGRVPFGIAAIETNDTVLAAETCEELFTPDSPHIKFGLDGVEIVTNGSGSHHQLRKLNTRLELIQSATRKSGGVYIYANQQGCDSGRLYFDGCALVAVNGDFKVQASQFSLLDVEVVTATVDLEEVRSYRSASSSRGEQVANLAPLPRVRVDFNLCVDDDLAPLELPTPTITPYIHEPMAEIALGPACWLWDYLRRSGANGFFLPLSGGADSASTAGIVGVMTRLVAQAADPANPLNLPPRAVEQIVNDARRIVKAADDSTWRPTDARDFASHILHTCYMGTTNSSSTTRDRAAAVAEQIGSYHQPAVIDRMVDATKAVFTTIVATAAAGGTALANFVPKFKADGGNWREGLALENIQARLRMVLSYFLAQLLLWVRVRTDPSSVSSGKFDNTGFLLVLGSANVDEALMGYFTKYDCSAADINPIGGIAKRDVQAFLRFAGAEKEEEEEEGGASGAEKDGGEGGVWGSPGGYGWSALLEVEQATPTAELKPLVAGAIAQTDEDDMGMTYEELGVLGRLRKIHRCGPVSMFRKAVHKWDPTHADVAGVAFKVKKFYSRYARNRHKMTTLTPAYHAENYSPEDNRFDLRPFLYPSEFTRQYAAIDAMVAAINDAKEKKRGGSSRA